MYVEDHVDYVVKVYLRTVAVLRTRVYCLFNL